MVGAPGERRHGMVVENRGKCANPQHVGASSRAEGPLRFVLMDLERCLPVLFGLFLQEQKAMWAEEVEKDEDAEDA